MKKALILTLGIIWFVVSIMFSACQKEVVEPEYRIEGYYVLDDGSNLTNQYILFKDASVSVFKAQQKLVFIEDRIWNFNSKFSRLSTSIYSIQNGVLNSDIWKDTPIKLENGVLKFGEKTYSAWSGQTERGCYSSINVSPTREVSYIAQLDTIPYSIGKPIPSGHLTAVSGESWLTVENVSNDKIIVHLDENNSGDDRSCNLQLNYDGDAAATCLVTQKWAASSFSLTPEGQNTDYTGGDYSFSFAVENTRDGATVTVACQVDWITVVAIFGDIVSYKVAENNSGAQRSGNIRLAYGNYATADFTVTQAWSASSLILTPDSQNTDYTGGDYSFSFAIENPREGITVTAASQANWITDVAISGNIVSYKVAENNSGAQRSGNIRLSYGNFASVNFTVTQDWAASSFILALENQNTDYTGGDYSFSFAVENPREGITVTAASQANWITDVAISGSNVNYKVAENYSNAQRSGKIKLTYGSYAKAEFTVTQKGTPVTSLSLNKSNLALHTGNSEKLVATVEPSDATLAWSSSNTSVATVSSDGTVTAAGNGTATITVSATDGSGKNATCTVAVTTLVSSITLDKTSLTLHPGGSSTLTPTVLPSTASNKALTWTSSNISVATVSNSGVVTAAGNGTATITVSATDGSGKNATCTVAVTTLVSSISLDKTSLDLYKGDSFTLSATVSPSTASNKALTWTSSNISVVTVSNSGVVTAAGNGTATITVSATDGSGKNDKCKVTVSIRPPEAIDMGTVVNGKNIKWASFNLGASKPEEYGLYYAWGETEPKGNYSWSTYKWCNGSSSTLTKYNNSSSYGTVDNKRVLEPSDDVASVNLGGKWRMPTDAEWTELRTKCTWTWTTNYNGTRVKGRIVTAPNGNSIFLPAAGSRYGTDLRDAGSNGYYWYSSLNRSNPLCAWIVGFFSDNVYVNDNLRYSGLSVRPVSE